MSALPEMPAWLLAAANDQRLPPPQTSQSVPLSGGAATLYGKSALASELSALRQAKPGGRNDQLNRSVFALAQLAAAGEIDADGARAALVEAAFSIGLTHDEIEATLVSGWQAGQQRPRGSKSAGTLQVRHPVTISANVLAQKHFAELEWAVPGILPEGLAILAGRPKFGKSFLSLQLAIAIATGEGAKFEVPELEAGDVLVCALEDSERRLRDRLRRFHPFGNAPARLHFATDWPRLGQGGIEAFEAWCDLHPNARLVVIDTWRAIKPPAGRASAYDEDANAAAPLLDFARRHPGLAVLVVHHVRKSEADDPFDTISGTHGLTGIFDTLMVLGRHGEGAKLVAQGRDLDGYEKALERDRQTGGWIVTGAPVPLAKTGERQELLTVMARAENPMRLAALANAVGKAPDTTHRLLAGLITEGFIHQPGHGLYALTSQSAQNAQFEDEPAF